MERLHRDATVVLAYVVMPQRMSPKGMDCAFLARDGDFVADIPKLLRGGVNVVFWSPTSETDFDIDDEGFMVYEPRWGHGMLAVKRWLWSIDAAHRLLEDNPDHAGLALNCEDVQRLAAAGKLAVVLHLTSGGDIIDKDLNILRTYYRLGVRSIQLPHVAVEWINSDLDQPIPGGITDFGRKVIREMNRLGMVIDMAHGSDEAALSVCELSEHPIVISHSCARALINRRRFVPDDVLKALARNRGVIGVFFSCHPDPSLQLERPGERTRANERMKRFMAEEMGPLKERYDDPFDLTIAQQDMYYDDNCGLRQEKKAAIRASATTVGDILNQIDHMVNVTGVDHVGIGTDFCGCGPIGPRGIEDVSKMPVLTQALHDRGYKDEDIVKILGANFMRVFREATGG